MPSKKALAPAVIGLSAILALTACGRTNTPSTPSGSTGSTGSTSTTAANAASIIIGSTDKATALDPAGSYDHGSLAIQSNVFQFLYTFVPGNDVPQPDAAKSCAFTQPTLFVCTLKSGLKFANGHDLTSSDVKFSFDRILKINSDVGPASLLGNLDSIATPDATTVNFTLKSPNDQTFLQVLATNAGPIVDEEVLSATALTPDDAIVAGNAFSGPYTIKTFKTNDTVTFAPYAGYDGALPKVANGGITLKTYTDATNLKMAISSGEVDIAARSLTPTDIASLQADKNVTVWEGKGGEIRYITFNMKTQPGDTDAQKFAIRQAVASLIDRQALSTNVYKGQYTPLCSYVADGFPGANKAVCDTYPLDKDKAAKFLSDAGVATPVVLNMEYNPDHYGSSSDQEYGLVKQQLESSGLFQVNLQSAEWTTYSKQRTQDAYPVYQMGWFPDFPDADNYLTPFFAANSFLKQHFASPNNDKDDFYLAAPDVLAGIQAQVTETDATKRVQQIQDVQTLLAQKYLPTIPLLQGQQWAFSRTNIKGITLMVDEFFPWSPLTKTA